MKHRVNGEEGPFRLWLRSFKDRNPEVGGFTANDVDFLLHLYDCPVMDRQAKATGRARELKAIMGLEVKTSSRIVEFGQMQALWHFHLSMNDVKPDPAVRRDYTIRVFGWSFLQLSGSTPDDSKTIKWGRFDAMGLIQWREIDPEMVNDLIGFVRHPESLKLQPFHRHHGSKNIWRMEAQPLGFAVPVLDVEKY